MKNEAKNKKDKNTVTIKATSEEAAPVVEYTAIKRMLDTLDRFLTKRFMLVIAFCLTVVSGCAIGLMFDNKVFAFSSSGGGDSPGGSLTTTVWLGAIITVAVFIIILTIVHAVRKKKKTRLRSQEA